MRLAPFPLLVFVLASARPTAAQGTTLADDCRAAIAKAVTWLDANKHPVPDHDGAVTFAAPGERAGQPQVYGGAAGVLIFLENVAAALDDERARALADAAAAGLRASRRDGAAATWVPSTEGASSLYVGDAGIGQAFLIRARLREDGDALALATAVGDALIARAVRDGDRLSWDAQVEIIYGAAGTALFLLELGEVTGEERFRDAARASGRWLIAQAESAAATAEGQQPERQLSWRWALANDAAYVNFSHGTAGVAYALSRIAVATGDAACAGAAQAGAAWLLARTVRDGDRAVWPVLAGSERTMGSWCHGPPGTARLFLHLHAVSGEQRHLDVALASARWVMAQAPEADAGGDLPRAFPPSYCCGVAGVLDFFCDLYRVTGDEGHRRFAERAGRYLLATAQTDGEGLKWARGATAHGRGGSAFHTDLMLGAAGAGMALLRLATIEDVPDPVRHLPDRRVTK